MSNNVKFNKAYFDTILKSAGVTALCKQKAEQVASVARSTAPVDTGAYRDSIHVEPVEFSYRKGMRVIADDKKALLVEMKTGNLARAVKKVK